MSLSTAIWDYPSPTSSTPHFNSASASSTSVTSPSSPSELIFQVQSLSADNTPKMSTPPGTVDPARITTTSNRPGRRKKNLMPVYPGPLREEDDWTKVKDPKEKKRIQNRVAQRTYRHRMKARLGELQARLDSHERIKVPQATPDISDSSTSPGVVRGFTAINQMPGLESSPSSLSPMSQDKTPISELPLIEPSAFEQPVDETDSMFQTISENNLDSPQQTQTPPERNGLLSPPSHPVADRTLKLPQDFFLDCLRFQLELLNRLNSLQQELGFPPSFAPAGGALSQVLEAITHVEQASCIDPFSPTHADAMEFSFDANLDVWKTDALSSKIRPSTASNNALAFPSITAPTTPSAVLDSSPVADSNPAEPQSDIQATSSEEATSTEERIEAIMETIQAAGFSSFDALVSAYYCDTFGEASPLANEQRLSRNRRLPKLIDDIFRATKKWSSWERRGFQEEIIKTAESMLISEGAGARPSLMSKITPVLDSHDAANPAATAEALVNLKRSIQDELPNLWALTMALASDSRNSWQRDRSNTALATTLLVSFSGRMPNDQLLQILGACL